MVPSALCTQQAANPPQRAPIAAAAAASCRRTRAGRGTAAAPAPSRLVPSIPGRAAAIASSSAAAAAAAAAGAPGGAGLLVVGPGVLGSYLAKLWLDAHGPGTVVGQTNSEANHARLRRLGVAPRTKGAAAGGGRFANVAFCAPPSGSADYVAEVEAALAAWDGTGAFVFTSSTGVLAGGEDGAACDDATPALPLGAGERTDRLLRAEAAVAAGGGCVARLAGLYHRDRGAHTFFLKQGRVERWGGYTVNLLHYEDAAALAFAILAARDAGGAPLRGRTFLGCDGAPVTFDAMMAAVSASGVLGGGAVEFAGAPGARGKLLSNPATRAALGWAPKYASIEAFFAAGGRDWYAEQAAEAPAGAPHA